MSSPISSSPTLFSRSPSVDGVTEDERHCLIDADIETAQKRRLFSTRSSVSDFDSESEAIVLGHTSRAKHRNMRIGQFLRYLQKRTFLVCVAAAVTLFLTFSLSTTTHVRGQLYRHGAVDANHAEQSDNVHSSEHIEDGIWPGTLGAGGTTALCDICDCATQPGYYAPKPEASRYHPRTQVQAVYPKESSVNRDAYMRQAILDIYCSRQHMSTPQTTRLVRRTASHLEQMISWNVTGLDFEKPTVYLTTNTSPNGKANELRPQFFRRHARTILDWQNTQSQLANGSDWQVVWLIVEDELDIDPEVTRTLRRIGVPFVYYAYGPTNGLGHAQRNAALQLIYTLTQSRQRGGLLGHGPVYCLDDDNRIEPELLTLLTKVQRIGVFPVGNFGVPGGYEKPIVSPIGEVMGSNSPWPNRTYPFDNAGFAFNSNLLGTQISGPTFWKWNLYGGESEFIGQVVSDVRQLEPLCGRDEAQDCRLAWHNEPLALIETLTDDAEADFIQRFGWDTWRTRRDEELRSRLEQRGY